jgi:hypothetical protein
VVPAVGRGERRVASDKVDRRSGDVMRRLRIAMGAMALATAAGCGWPETRVEPAANYQPAKRPTVSAAPAYTAGPDTVLTTSPDGSALVVCPDGRALSAGDVPAGSKPAC